MAELQLQIKNPSQNMGNGDFVLSVPASATVGDVKARLSASYPGSPAPASITIIYAGRVLKQDEARLASFLQQVGLLQGPGRVRAGARRAGGRAVHPRFGTNRQ